MAFQSCIAFLDKRNLILLINPTLNLYCPQGRSLTWASVLSSVEGNFWRGNQRRDINHQYLWQLRNEFLVPRRRSGQCNGTSTIYLDSLREEDLSHFRSSRQIVSLYEWIILWELKTYSMGPNDCRNLGHSFQTFKRC